MGSLPIADRTRLLQISRGNTERAREFFIALTLDAQVSAGMIQDAHSAGDLAAMCELAHALKGMALEVGAPRVAAAAAALERECDAAALHQCVTSVAATCRELPAGLDALERF